MEEEGCGLPDSIVGGKRFCACRVWKISIGGKKGGLFMDRTGALIAEPLVTITGIVALPFFVLLDEAGVVHGTQLANEDGFGFLIEFGGECHGSDTMSMGLRMLTISCRFVTSTIHDPSS